MAGSSSERAQALSTLIPSKADALATLCVLYMLVGRQEEATSLAKQALSDAESTYGPHHYQMGLALHTYAAVLRYGKRAKEAKSAEKRATQILSTAAPAQTMTNAIIDVTTLVRKGKK